mmetsp:Transcript_4925/g.11042  ORF Transcript_4925/g.11042 Transcript_4925/m.11042 type:complete len:217 (+) Transcript_4925:886-1536(+)
MHPRKKFGCSLCISYSPASIDQALICLWICFKTTLLHHRQHFKRKSQSRSAMRSCLFDLKSRERGSKTTPRLPCRLQFVCFLFPFGCVISIHSGLGGFHDSISLFRRLFGLRNRILFHLAVLSSLRCHSLFPSWIRFHIVIVIVISQKTSKMRAGCLHLCNTFLFFLVRFFDFVVVFSVDRGCPDRGWNRITSITFNVAFVLNMCVCCEDRLVLSK